MNGHQFTASESPSRLLPLALRGLFVLLLALPPFVSFGQSPGSTDALRQGILEEEANQNLNAAIEAYKTVVERFDEQRKTTATALFRLGECYRKQGKTNEALASYLRIVREFADEANLVRLSQKQLAEAGRSNLARNGPVLENAPGQAPFDPEQVRLLREEIALVQQEIDSVERARENGAASSADLARPKRDLLALQRKLPENSASTEQKSLINQEIQLVNQLLTDCRKRVEVGHASPGDEIPLKRDLLRLQREALAVEKGPQFTTRLQSIVRRADDAPPEAELQEIERLKRVFKNSPDLMNVNQSREGVPPLHAAAAEGQLAVAGFLLDNGADVNGRDRQEGLTALHAAASRGNKAMAELLCARGADASAKDNKGRTPLHKAASHGFVSVGQVLIANGAAVNGQADGGDTPLHLAVSGGHTAMVDLLLAEHADLNLKGAGGHTSLTLVSAAGESMVPIAERLLRHGAAPDVEAAFKFTPSNRGAGPPYRDVYRARLLHFAAAENHLPLAQLLLEYHADVNARDVLGRTPLTWAVRNMNAPIVKLLLSKGAKTNVADEDGSTPLTSAIELRTSTLVQQIRSTLSPNLPQAASAGTADPWKPVFDEIFTALFENGVDPNYVAPPREDATPRGIPALIWAVHLQQTNLVRLLLEKGAGPNSKGLNGYTSLHIAAARQDLALVQMLCAAGADVQAQDDQGNTPLHYAIYRGGKRVVEALLARGAKLDAKNRAGLTPLDLSTAEVGEIGSGPSLPYSMPYPFGRFTRGQGRIPNPQQLEVRDFLSTSPPQNPNR